MLVQLLSHGIQFECIWWWFLLTLSFVLDLYCPGADATSAYICYRKRQNSQTPVNLRISTDELFSVCCCYWMEGWNLDQATFPDMDEFLGGIRHEKLKNQSSCNPRVITMCAGSAAYWQPCGGCLISWAQKYYITFWHQWFSPCWLETGLFWSYTDAVFFFWCWKLKWKVI